MKHNSKSLFVTKETKKEFDTITKRQSDDILQELDQALRQLCGDLDLSIMIQVIGNRLGMKMNFKQFGMTLKQFRDAGYPETEISKLIPVKDLIKK